jgi:hypothetical protein
VDVRDGGRWCLEDSLPMMLESERWLAAASSSLDREALPWAVMERARVCDGLCATVAPWAWARVGWVAVWEFEMSCAVGSFALALERVCALFRRPTGRGRATEGEVGEAALLLLLSLDCELPIVCVRVRARYFCLRAVSSLHLDLHSASRRSAAGRLAGWLLSSSRLEAAHAVAANGTRGRGGRQGKANHGVGNAVVQSVRRSCRQPAFSTAGW